ncbi:MAG: hypothetical protein WAO98_07990 [Alphaproteobacteria bacterium]
MQTPTAMHVVDLVTADDNKKYECAAKMALVIIEITNEKGSCLPQDLNERGFTPIAVTEHWHMAQSLASVEINLMCRRQ